MRASSIGHGGSSTLFNFIALTALSNAGVPTHFFLHSMISVVAFNRGIIARFRILVSPYDSISARESAESGGTIL